jgi:hypothetical protein
MEQEHPAPDEPTSIHPVHQPADASVAGEVRAGSFVPGPTPLQALEAQQRFMSAIASARARARQADRRAR